MPNENSKWKAWVDTMPPQKGGRLHVHGDVTVNDKAKYSLEKAMPQGINTFILLLKVNPKPTEGETDCHLEYHDDLDNPKMYTKVQIIHPPVTIDVEQVS